MPVLEMPGGKEPLVWKSRQKVAGCYLLTCKTSHLTLQQNLNKLAPYPPNNYSPFVPNIFDVHHKHRGSIDSAVVVKIGQFFSLTVQEDNVS